MHVFLTGATGYIGSAVSRRLLADGHTVTGLARNDEAEARLRAAGIMPYRGDLLDPVSLIPAVQAADAVINCATALSFEVDRGTVERNAVITMLDALVGTGKKFIYTSDQLIYGGTGDEIADEDTPLNPPPFIAWRAALEPNILAYKQRGVHVMIVRPVAVYGNGGDRMMPMIVAGARRIGSGFFVGDGQAQWSVVHVDDLADFYGLMLEKAPAGALLVASADTVTMRRLGEIGAEIAGLAGQVRSLSVEEAQQVFGPFVPVQSFITNLRVSGQRGRDILGWRPHRPTIDQEAQHGAYAHIVSGK